MLNFNIGLEAEIFLKDINGEIISPHLSLPIDGSGNVVEIRAEPSIIPQNSIENFYKKFESVKELCYPNLVFLSKKEKLNKKIIKHKAYSYKGEDYKEESIIKEIEQTCGLHIHINTIFLESSIDVESIIDYICKEFDNELFKIIPFDNSRNLSNYRFKNYSKEVKGFEYRSLYFDESTLKLIPQIVNKVFEILNNNNKIKEIICKEYISNLLDFEKINQNELLEYIEKLYKK